MTRLKNLTGSSASIRPGGQGLRAVKTMKVSDTQLQGSTFAGTLVSSALGGYAGGYLCFPFEGLKKRLQRGELLPSDFWKLNNGKVLKAIIPTELFRGSTAFASSVTVASATSITFNSLLRKLPFYDDKVSSHQLAAAVASGMLGAIAGSTPVENTILIQQELNVGPYQAVKHMLRQGLTRPWVGAPELMVREGGFAGVMLYAGPSAHEFALKETNDHRMATLAEIIAGIGGAIVTHPADSLATFRQKANGEISTLEGMKRLYDKGGVKLFFRGVSSRIFLFTGCSMIIPRVTRQVETSLPESLRA